MAQKNLKVATANKIIVTFDGKKVGGMKSCRANDDYGHELVTEIGDIHGIENVPTVARHTLSCSNVVLNAGSLRAAGLALENGDDALLGTVFDIVFLGKEDGQIVRKYMGCSYTSGDYEVNANAIVMANAQFSALDVSGTGG